MLVSLCSREKWAVTGRGGGLREFTSTVPAQDGFLLDGFGAVGAEHHESCLV